MTDTPPVYELQRPACWDTPLIFSSPHSGSFYPRQFLEQSKLPHTSLRKLEDYAIDQLFQCCTDTGAPLLKSNVARACIDLNREAYELDPRMYNERLPCFANTSSARLASGLGTIPRLVAEGEDIYAGKLALDDALDRIARIYAPYHHALQNLQAEAKARSGLSVLVDCHSMPSHVVGAPAALADVVIGDRFGTSCSPDMTDYIEMLFQQQGFSVARNKPYAGGFITQHYGCPRHSHHAIQIEINRRLYMNENTFEKTANFVLLQNALRNIIFALSRSLRETSARPLAAE